MENFRTFILLELQIRLSDKNFLISSYKSIFSDSIQVKYEVKTT